MSGRVIDSYVTGAVLPNEVVSGYVKWQPDFEVSGVSVFTEPDVLFFNVLNASDEWGKGYDASKAALKVEGRLLQVRGFFGFRALMTLVPEIERPLVFKITINFADGVTESIDLETRIVRPILLPGGRMPEVYVESASAPSPSILMALENRGSVEVKFGTLKAVVKVIEGKELKISSITDADVETTGEIFGHLKERASRFAVTGRGHGMILIAFKYQDVLGNEYQTPFTKILVTVLENASIEVPIGSEVHGQPSIAVSPSVPA